MGRGSSKAGGGGGSKLMAQYQQRILNATTEEELDDIIEEAANAEDANGNSLLTNEQYQSLYSMALTKAQTGQNPTIAQPTIKAGTTRVNSQSDIDRVFDAPKGTVLTIKDIYGGYIGEYTKGDGKKWVASQKRQSSYPAPRSVSSAKAMYNQIQHMNITIKPKK